MGKPKAPKSNRHPTYKASKNVDPELCASMEKALNDYQMGAPPPSKRNRLYSAANKACNTTFANSAKPNMQFGTTAEHTKENKRILADTPEKGKRAHEDPDDVKPGAFSKLLRGFAAKLRRKTIVKESCMVSDEFPVCATPAEDNPSTPVENKNADDGDGELSSGSATRRKQGYYPAVIRNKEEWESCQKQWREDHTMRFRANELKRKQNMISTPPLRKKLIKEFEQESPALNEMFGRRLSKDDSPVTGISYKLTAAQTPVENNETLDDAMTYGSQGYFK